jgi:hypothetical protein
MSGDEIQWWSMWSYTMAMCWKVVDVVVFAVGGDARDVVWY